MSLLLPKSLKMWLGRGWRIRRSGRSIYVVRGTFRDQNSISIRRMRSTKLTCSFCHMTACLEVERRTSMHSPSLTLPRATRRPSLWPQKMLKRLLKLSRIYRRRPLKWQKLLQVDPGREFMGAINQLLANHDVEVGRGRVDIHWDQGIVERFNRTLAEQLFGHKYPQEMRLPSGERSSEWVARLPAVVAALKWEVTRLTGKRPSETIKALSMTQKLPSSVGVRFLYKPGELEGGRRRATDPVGSLTVHRLGRSVTKVKR